MIGSCNCRIQEFMHKTHAFEKIVIAMITFDTFFILS